MFAAASNPEHEVFVTLLRHTECNWQQVKFVDGQSMLLAEFVCAKEIAGGWLEIRLIQGKLLRVKNTLIQLKRLLKYPFISSVSNDIVVNEKYMVHHWPTYLEMVGGYNLEIVSNSKKMHNHLALAS